MAVKEWSKSARFMGGAALVAAFSIAGAIALASHGDSQHFYDTGPMQKDFGALAVVFFICAFVSYILTMRVVCTTTKGVVWSTIVGLGVLILLSSIVSGNRIW